MEARSQAFRPLATTIALLLTFFLSKESSAQSYLGFAWPNHSFKYYANGQSFANSIGYGLSAAEYEQQIAWALSVWRERTGANIGFTYGGSTTSTTCPNYNSTLPHKNEVVALAGCADPPLCGILGMMFPYYSAGGAIVETDICIYATPGPYNVSLSMSNNYHDLIGALTHEFGHALGLDHTDNTVMDSYVMGPNGTLARYPYGYDIAGIQHALRAAGVAIAEVP